MKRVSSQATEPQVSFLSPPFPPKAAAGLNCPLSHVALPRLPPIRADVRHRTHTAAQPVNTDSAPCPSIPCLVHSLPKSYPSHLSQGCGGDDGGGGGDGEPLPARRPRLRGSDGGGARLKGGGEAGEGAKSWRSRKAVGKQLCK